MKLRAFKTEIDPTAAQRQLLARHVAAARVAHNWALERWYALEAARSMTGALSGHDPAGARAAWWLGAFLFALHRGEVSSTRKPLRKKVEGATAYATRYRWKVALPYDPPDRSPNSDWIHSQLTAEKNRADSDLHWLTEVSSFAVREGVADLGKSYEAFFRRLKKHRAGDHSECKPRWGGGCVLGQPRFRRSTERSWHCDQPNSIRVTDRAIRVPGIGWIKLKEHGYLPSTSEKSHHLRRGGRVCAVACSEHGGRWYIALRCHVQERKAKPRNGNVIGVDSGVIYLATTSEGQRFPGLEADAKLASLERCRKLWERRMARRWKNGVSRRDQSSGWHDAKRRVAHYHRRIVEVRDDRVGKAVAAIVATGASVVVVRGQPVNEMLTRDGSPADRTRNVLAPRVHGARMGDLASKLEYKMQWAGGECLRAPADFPSTKRCHVCEHVRESDPGYPTWTCENCGTILDRELNAAMNLRDYRPPSGESVDSGRSDRDNPSPSGGGNGRENRSARVRASALATASDGDGTSPLGSGKRARPAARLSGNGTDAIPLRSDLRCERSGVDEIHGGTRSGKVNAGMGVVEHTAASSADGPLGGLSQFDAEIVGRRGVSG